MPQRSGVVALMLLLAACQPGTSARRPVLQVRSPAATSEGHYLIDFGLVSVTKQSRQNLVIGNVGQTPMVVSPVAAPDPFAAVTTSNVEVPPEGTLELGILFKPSVPGTFQETVTLETTGGSVTLELTGKGVTGPVPECRYSVQPAAVVFGNVEPGQTKTVLVRVVNSGGADCLLQNIRLDPSSHAAFSLAPGQPDSATVTTNPEGYTIGVVFSPAQPAASFTGKLLFQVAPLGDSVHVALSGSSSQSPCAYRVAPTSLDFGNTVVGHPITRSVSVTRTGTIECAITDVQVDPSSHAAFTLAVGQPTSGTLPTASSAFQVAVTLSPTRSGSFTGKVTFTANPGARTVTVPLTGTSPDLCEAPNTDGSCPPAAHAIYLNTWSDLYWFDPATHAATHIGEFHGPDRSLFMGDIAIDAAGQLIGVSDDKIYIIDPESALCTRVGELSPNNSNGLTFMADGTLVVAGDDVLVVDPVSYATLRLLVPGGRYTSSGDVIWLPDGNLFWTVVDGMRDALLKVDPLDGTTTRVGSLGQAGVRALAYDKAANMLYGFKSGNYLEISQTDAIVTAGDLSGAWTGATANPKLW